MILLTDIHGNFLTMKALLDKIPQEEKDKGIVICGDLIDRGPRSREVVQYVIDNNIKCVMGNHELMMIEEYIQTMHHLSKCDYLPHSQSIWTMNGGYEALKSYSEYDENDCDDRGVPKFKFMEETFRQHKEWMENLPLYIEFEDVKKDGRHLVVSHSSINNVWKHRDNQDNTFQKNVLWGRPSTIKDVKEIYNVFGHTPQQWGAKVKVPFANIDTGCFYKEDGYGQLTALQFPEMVLYTQENID